MNQNEYVAFQHKKTALFYIISKLSCVISKEEALNLNLQLTESEKESEYIMVYHKNKTEMAENAFNILGANSEYLSWIDIYDAYNKLIEETIDNKDDINRFNKKRKI